MKKSVIIMSLTCCLLGAGCSRSNEEITAGAPTVTPTPASETKQVAVTKTAVKGPEPKAENDPVLTATPIPPQTAEQLAATDAADATKPSEGDKKEDTSPQAAATQPAMERALPARENAFETPPPVSPIPR